MDEKIRVIIIAYVIVPAILCTICLISYIIRNRKRNSEKEEFIQDLSKFKWITIIIMLVTIIKLVDSSIE